MEQNRNFFITIALSVVILTLWQVFYMNPRIESQREVAQIEAERAETEQAAQPGGSGTDTAVPPVGGVPGVAGADGGTEAGRAQAVDATKRVPVDTPSLVGSINLTGGRLDDLRLKDYHLTVDPNSPIIELLNPQALPSGFFAEIKTELSRRLRKTR